MKKLFIIPLLVILTQFSFGQVFNTGQTLKAKTFSVGFEPAVLINGSNEFMLFLHGGYGLRSGIDFGLNVGVLGPETYIGADVEFAIAKRISLAVGAHDFGVFGLDGTLNFTIPIKSGVRLFSGLDLDVNFTEPETQFLLWLPVGLDIGIKKNMSFILEAEIGLTDPAYHLIGGGLNFYF
ncbi:MAG: hypothetical protein F9K37_02590 [Bacteroidales bacterium]|nr:MAG: hypothetical protein F9K37_02590 [Bacteroidales bacterium]